MTSFVVAIAGFLLGTVAFFLVMLVLPSRYQSEDSPLDERTSNGNKKPRTSVQVLVLGDIGRSPRTEYHAISIAKHGGRVDLIGYRESEPHPELTSNPLVSIVPIPPPPKPLQTDNRSLFILYGPLKVLWQVWNLWLILGYRTNAARWLLVQNPPSIPTMAVAYLICLLRDTHLLVDWHNFGWSVLALKLGDSHPLVKIAKRYEYFFGKMASANFTVTDAMARILKEDYGIFSPILTLHDHPAAEFRPFSAAQRSSFLSRLSETSTLAPEIVARRTRLLVSSTSWSADEDFTILLQALIVYSSPSVNRDGYESRPHILAIITGKGPRKQYYLDLISAAQGEQKLSKATIMTAWLSTSDYASLLASADLGVSLHASTSGVDFPMKVVDMFGAGLPVVGWSKFEAWGERVREGVNGRGFESAAQLASALMELFGEDGSELARLKEGAVRTGRSRWDDEWGPIAGRILGLCD